MNKNYPITSELLDDLFNVQYLIVFNGSGIALISIDVGKIKIPDLLISGLLQAILAMINELKPKSDLILKEERLNVHEISESEHGFIIYFCQGSVEDQKVVLAVVCSRKCSLALKKRIKEALSAFIMTFEEEIKQFYGSIYPFTEKGIELLDDMFGLHFLNPFELNSALLSQEHSIKPEFSQIIDIVKNLYLDLELVEGEGIFLRELIDTGIRNISLPYLDLLGTIIDMVTMQLLVPVKQEVLLAENTHIEPNLPIPDLSSTNTPHDVLSLTSPHLQETIPTDNVPAPPENGQSAQKPFE